MMKLKEEFGWSATIELVATWFTSSGTCFELLFCRSTRCRSTFKFATGLPFAVVRRLPRLRMSHLWYRGHAVFRNNSILFTLASPPRLLLPRGLDYEGLTRQETLRTTRRPRTMKNTTSRGRRLGLEFLREPSEVRSSRRTDMCLPLLPVDSAGPRIPFIFGIFSWMSFRSARRTLMGALASYCELDAE